jgi:hypothetical protein
MVTDNYEIISAKTMAYLTFIKYKKLLDRNLMLLFSLLPTITTDLTIDKKKSLLLMHIKHLKKTQEFEADYDLNGIDFLKSVETVTSTETTVKDIILSIIDNISQENDVKEEVNALVLILEKIIRI